MRYFKLYKSETENISIEGKLKFVHTDSSNLKLFPRTSEWMSILMLIIYMALMKTILIYNNIPLNNNNNIKLF